MRKTRLPVSLNEATWMITETASSDEQAADDGEHDLVLGGDGDRAEHAAERQRAGVAHEDRRRRRVEPQEAEAGAEHRAADDRKFAGARHEVDLQIVGEDRVAGEIGDDAEARRRDHHRHDGEAVEAVGQVHRIAGADDDEGGERERRTSRDRGRTSLTKGKASEVDSGSVPAQATMTQATAAMTNSMTQAEPAGKAFVGLLGDLEIVVIEADQRRSRR